MGGNPHIESENAQSGWGRPPALPMTAGMPVALLAVLTALIAASPAAASGRVPIVSPTTGDARGTVILIHGGAWVDHGPQAAMREHLRHAARVNRLGFDTVAITYRPGIRSIADVVDAYDGLRRRLGDGEAICALGDSAGGHLALMLAARRRGLDCAIARGAPTDLRRAHGVWQRPVALRFAPFAPLGRVSPVTYAGRLAGRVLASQALHDPLVRHDQLVRLRRAADIATATLGPGGADYVHARVNARDLRTLERSEARLLDAAADRRRAQMLDSTA